MVLDTKPLTFDIKHMIITVLQSLILQLSWVWGLKPWVGSCGWATEAGITSQQNVQKLWLQHFLIEVLSKEWRGYKGFSMSCGTLGIAKQKIRNFRNEKSQTWQLAKNKSN